MPESVCTGIINILFVCLFSHLPTSNLINTEFPHFSQQFWNMWQVSLGSFLFTTTLLK